MRNWKTTIARSLLLFAVLFSFSSISAAGVLNWGKPNDVDALDPHVSGNGVSWQVTFLMYETLVEPNDDFSFSGLIAESWEQPTASSYIFHLRKDAKFSNGRHVSADDVVKSLQRLTNPETGSFWAQQLGSIKEISATDGHTVHVELEQPLSSFLAAIANPMASILPMKELEDGSFDPTKEILGSGPFMVVEHLQDESWTLAPNPHYWRAGYPKVEGVKIEIIQDDASRIAALRDGRIHIANFDSPDTPSLTAGEPNIKTIIQNTTDYYRIDVQSLPDSDSPFADQRVRQAMILALDRQKILDLALAGTGAIDYPVPQAFASSSVCRDMPSYRGPRSARVEIAKALMKEAGAEGTEVSLIASPTVPVFPLIAQIVKESMKDIGMTVNVEAVPRGEWLTRVFVDGNFDMAMSWFAGFADPIMVPAWWDPNFSGWNVLFLEKDAALATLLNKSKETSHGPERDALLGSICELIDAQASMVALISKPAVIAYRDDLLKPRIHEVEGYVNHFKYIEEYELLD